MKNLKRILIISVLLVVSTAFAIMPRDRMNRNPYPKASKSNLNQLDIEDAGNVKYHLNIRTVEDCAVAINDLEINLNYCFRKISTLTNENKLFKKEILRLRKIINDTGKSDLIEPKLPDFNDVNDINKPVNP